MNVWHLQRQDSRYGFSLVEISVVLVVIAIITGMGVSAGIDALSATYRVSTATKLDVIEDALLSFRKKYNRLPCPGDLALAASNTNYGIEAANNSGTCFGGTPSATYQTAVAAPTYPFAIPSGAIPARTLGLPDEFMYDGWGNKFQYEVTPVMTMDNAFSHSQLSDDCALTVNDNSGTALTYKPVYAITSFGKNGIGAFTEGTTAIPGTAGTAEQANIRTVTTTPTVRLKTSLTGALGSAGYYDDIVRFKNRYQLMDDNDRTVAPYVGPELVVTYATGGSSPQIVYGKRKCGRLENYPGSTPALVAAAFPIFAAFTASNSHLFVYHNIANTCKLYKIVGTTVSAVDAATPVQPSCPTGTTTGTMAQGNSMLAMNTTSAPYLRVWRLVGSGASAQYAELSTAISPVLAAMPEHLSMSENGEYIAAARHSATAYARLYKKKDDRYQAMTTLDGAAAATQNFTPNQSYTVYSNAISPNGKYYAATVISGGNTLVYIWRNINGAFTQITSGGSAILYTVTGMTAPNNISFSPDSNFLAISGTSSANNMVALYINPVTEAVSAAYAATRGSVPGVVSFTANSSFMVASHPAAGASAMVLYRRSGTSFTQDSTTNLTFNGAVLGAYVVFSR